MTETEVETELEPGANSHHGGEPVEPEVRPTYAPAAMALGVMMLLWGVVTMWIMSAAGAALIAWSLWSWIGDMQRSPSVGEQPAKES